MAFSEIPVVDIGPAFVGTEPDPVFSADFTQVCHEVGFALIENHGISTGLQDDVFAMMREFFALADDDKRRIDKRSSPQFRGWEPVGAETTDNAPDIREQIDVWTAWPEVDLSSDGPVYQRLLGPNQWMPNEFLAGHEELSLQWIDALAGVADALMSSLSSGLGLGPSYLRDLFGDQPMSLAKFIHYPATPSGGAGVNPHHDAGFLTVLAPGQTPGLQVQNPEGLWVDVPVTPNTLVVNLGEILQTMTGNYLVATPHRVITQSERYSAGYFHGPSLTTQLSPLPLAPEYAEAVTASDYHQSAGLMPTPDEALAGKGAMASDHRPGTYGEQLWNYFSRSYRDQMLAHHADVAS